MLLESLSNCSTLGRSCNSSEEERGESEDESAEWSFRETSPTNSSDEVDIGEETQ